MKVSEQVESIQALLKKTKINGCITGSSLIDGACFDMWDQTPDVDVFCYTRSAWVMAITEMTGLHGFQPASMAEKWKLGRVALEDNPRQKLSTIKLARPQDDVVVNFTVKKDQDTMLKVIGDFDMSLVMRGHDIRSGVHVDLSCVSGNDPDTVVPNPFKSQDATYYNTSTWVRQFDRVVKYWSRGYDTTPMAEMYLSMIDECIDTGNVFATDKAAKVYEEFCEEFTAIRSRIVMFLEMALKGRK